MWQSTLQLVTRRASDAVKDPPSANAAAPSEIDALLVDPTLASSQPEFISGDVPPPPEFVFGHGAVIESVAKEVLSSSAARIAILGQSGFGKSTLAVAVLHDPQVTTTFPSRYFVSCELAPTTELLEDLIADAISIPRPIRRSQGITLVSQIVSNVRRLSHPVLICIDDLEKLWDLDAEKQKLAQFLDCLSVLGPKLALVVIMRGTQEPKTSFPWSSSILPGFSTNQSISMYEALSNQTANKPARKLLSKLNGCPLAVKLLALLVREGDTPSQLRSRWIDYNYKTHEIDENLNPSSLEQIIHLSIFNARISNSARLVLGLIALMPYGLSTSQPWLKDFESTLPAGTDLRLEIRALERAALLEKGGMSRVRMFPPIRQFCLTLVVPPSRRISSLIRSHIRKVIEHWDIWNSTSQSVIPLEMPNIRSLLLYGSTLKPLPHRIGRASAGYTNWAGWQGADESALLCSFLRLSNSLRDKANIYHSLGKVHKQFGRLDAAIVSFSRSVELFTEAEDQQRVAEAYSYIAQIRITQSRLEDAEASFTLALKIYVRLRDRMGEADIHAALGDFYRHGDRLDTAEVSFTRALKLCKQARDSSREAKVHYAIGHLQDLQNRLDEAEISFNHALTRYSECQDFYGKAYTHRAIGHLHGRRGQLNAAEASYMCALEFYIKAQDRWDEAAIYISVGRLHMRRNQLDQAGSSFSCALKIYSEVEAPLGKAIAHWSIGDLHIKQYRLDAAKASFECALDLYGRISDREGEAETHESIGEVHVEQNRLDEAEQSFAQALQLYHEISSQTGEASTHISIGDLHMQRDRLDSAETSFNRALELYGGLSDRSGEARSRHFLGCLHLRRDQLDEAEASLTKAMEFYVETRQPGREAGVQVSMGELYLHRGHLDAAEAFARALAVWEELGDVRGIARAHQALGDFHLQKMHFYDAEMFLNIALNQYTTKVEARRFEALTNHTIGELHVQHGQLEEGEQAFRHAVDLYVTADSRLGQAESHRGLGRLFMSKGDLDSAESSYAVALRLFFEIKDYQAISCLEELGKVWAKQGRMEESEGWDVEVLRAHWNSNESLEIVKDDLPIDT
ncbi:hypothetical protein DL96DRAFT_1562451 [Flagelloscypha sp. PMI_526]|nr:hypothetical protein DL96DRAFT_1562451 [Flagelloscypha sp. PMI_526]